MPPNFLLVLIVLGMTYPASTNVHLKITKIICNFTDPEFAQVEWCILKPESRHVQYLKLRVKVFKTPITDFKIRVQIMKRLNGWKPFLYDVTISCNFTRHLNKLTGYVWQYVRNVSNIRQTDCPITQSMYEAERIDNGYVEDALKTLPVPAGDYGVFVTISAENKTRGYANAFGTIF